MRHGFRISIALSEFATAAALITIAACAVSYFYTKPAAVVPVKEEPTVINHYITVPAPQVHLRIVVPPPPKQQPEPKTDMWIEPEKQPPVPKVWDNDNIPSASDPPLMRASLQGKP